MRTRHSWKSWALVLGCSGALQMGVIGAVTAVAAPLETPGSTFGAKSLEASNLARLAAGARLEVQAPGKTAPAEDATASDALLRDDDPLGYALAPGSTSLIVTLPKIEVLNRFNFLNLTAHGKVAVAISSTKLAAGSSQWRPVQELDFSGDNGVITCDLGSVEAKYVRISFAVPAEGRIDTFGLYGQHTLGESPDLRGLASDKSAGSDARFVMYNYAVDSPHSAVVLVSPGEDLDSAQQMADGDVGTSYTFQPGDRVPMAVIDLGESRKLTRVGVSFKAGAGHLSVYLVPEAQRPTRDRAPVESAVPRVLQNVITTDFPGDRAPVLNVETGSQPGLNRVSANVDGESGRYLVMMFRPAGASPTAGGADFKDFKDTTAGNDFKDTGGSNGASRLSDAVAGNEPLQVAEITGYGNIPPGASLTTGSPLLPPLPPGPGAGSAGPIPPPVSPPGAGVITP